MRDHLISVPFLSLAYQHELRSSMIDAFSRVIDSKTFILGSEVEAFEQEFSHYTGTRFCVGTGNGLDALTLALMACRLTDQDEVIVPANTYIATWLAVSRAGARIVPVEPEVHSFNLDPRAVEAAITSRTKVIIPVHLFGQPCNMTALETLAKKHDLFLIEDNAQAHGAAWEEKRTGSFGHVNATSFYPTKNLGALGDAGAITTNDGSMAGLVQKLRNYGFEQKNISTELGVNSRLDETQAALLRIKLQKLEAWNEQRRELARRYLEGLAGVGNIIVPVTAEEATHVYHLFVIRTSRRNALKEHLEKNRIGTMVHYPMPPHLQPVYTSLGYVRGRFPITEKMADTMLSLPLWPGLKSEEQDYVISTIRDFFAQRA